MKKMKYNIEQKLNEIKKDPFIFSVFYYSAMKRKRELETILEEFENLSKGEKL